MKSYVHMKERVKPWFVLQKYKEYHFKTMSSFALQPIDFGSKHSSAVLVSLHQLSVHFQNFSSLAPKPHWTSPPQPVLVWLPAFFPSPNAVAWSDQQSIDCSALDHFQALGVDPWFSNVHPSSVPVYWWAGGCPFWGHRSALTRPEARRFDWRRWSWPDLGWQFGNFLAGCWISWLRCFLNMESIS